VAAEEQVEWEDDDEHGIWGRHTYRILKCRGCDTVYFQQVQIFSEDVDFRQNPTSGEMQPFIPERISYWPAPSKRNQPDWSRKLDDTDRDLGSLFDDIYVAMNNELRILAAIGTRTVFDRASELLGVDPAFTFAQKIAALHTAGRISSDDKLVIDVLVDAGNAAAHRGWKPSSSELNDMVAILEGFLYRAFVAGDAAGELRGSIPPRPPRRPPSP
jgi:hypothetical protein